MSKRLNKPILVRTRDENGNYITLNMSTGSRKTNYRTNQSTSVNKPRRKQNVKRTLKPGEQVFTDWRTGKKTVFTPRRTEVKSDNRSEYQKQEDQKTADILHQKYFQQKTTEEGLKNLEAIGKVISPSTYVGPLANKIAASVQGNKQDHRSIGEQILSGEGTGDTAGNLLLDFASPYVFSKLPNAAKQLYKAARYANNKVLDNLGSAAIYANGLGFDGTVGKSFFRDPNKAYRITEFPEVEGIRESGMNVTTRDAASKVNVSANNWRLSALDNYSHSKDGSWYKLPKSVSQYEEENPFSFVDIGNISDHTQVRLATKTGSAHGNRSQASLGKPWEGGLSTSGGLFPRGILEIQGGNKIAVGKDRVHFSLKDWEDALVGSRVGYKTGEMPLDNLTWYQRLPNGRYTMGEPVLPDKTIRIQNDDQPFMFDIDQPTSQYIGKDHLNIGSYIGEGGESFVYNTAGDPNTVTKIKVPISDSIEDYEGLQRAVSTEYQQNKLPFFFKQDYLGYTDKNSIPNKVRKAFGDEQFRIVTKQPKVTPFSKVADPWFTLTENDGRQGIFRYFDKDKIYNYLRKYGVEKTKDPYIYKYKNITFSDIRPQNAGIDKNGNFGFLDLIIHDYNSGKDIRIKPSKRGTFTKAAKQHGMSVQGFANRVLRNPSKYSAAMRKKANFAHNAASWKH